MNELPQLFAALRLLTTANKRSAVSGVSGSFIHHSLIHHSATSLVLQDKPPLAHQHIIPLRIVQLAIGECFTERPCIISQ